MRRVLLIVLDSVGAGSLPDAAAYGDEGANTIGNTVAATGLRLPNLERLGLGHISQSGLPPHLNARGLSARLAERSAGKDTTTGHWEIAGLWTAKPFPTFPDGFPAEFIKRYEMAIGRKTIGNKAASGTAILDELGEEHLRTGFPIVYTSADSVFQIAANEKIISNGRLYEMCRIARTMLTGDLAVGRVIARPFAGERAGAFKRTAARRDFSLEPTGRTILDDLKAAGHDVIGVGKIEDIFACRGITQSDHAAGNRACIGSMMKFLDRDFGGLLFVNLVDFDMVHGHRRDVKSYAEALADFDAAVPEILSRMGEDDLLLITADHGCDPTFRGTDHTREYAPLLAWRRGAERHKHLGDRGSFADVAATIAECFGLDARYGADSFTKELEDLS